MKTKKNRKIVYRTINYIKKIRVVCICKKGNCEGFCNGIGNVDIKNTVKPRKKRCNCRHR